MTTTQPWYKSPQVLIDDYAAFFPTDAMNETEKLNALVRLAIYVAIVLVLYTKQFYPLYIPFFAMVFSAFVLSSETSGKKKLRIAKSQSTPDNPFMNKLISDYVENPDKPEAPTYHEDSEEARLIKQEIEENFFKNMYTDANDVFNTQHSRRQFYTMPSTSLANNQKEFAEACFGNMRSCKSDRFDCHPVEDLRQKRDYIEPPSTMTKADS